MNCENCENCPYEQRMNDMEKSLENNSIQHKEFYEKLNKADVNMAVMLEKNGQMFAMIDGLKEDFKEVKADIKEFKDRPAKREETIVATVLGVIVTAFVSYLLMKGGLK